MTDIFSEAKRSEVMSRIRSRDTKPERLLRSALWRLGYRYRIAPKNIPGRPDIVFKRARLAVFVDGCFWHGCPAHYQRPKNRSRWWRNKLLQNRARDKKVNTLLRAEGWRVIRFWEHSVEKNVGACVVRVTHSLRRNTRFSVS